MIKILVGVDGSPRTQLVVAQALAMAEKFDGKLILVTAVGLPPEVPPHFWAATSMDLSGMLIENARRMLDGILDGLPKERVDAALVELGTGWDVICREAKARDVDLIMIGSHGYGGLDRLIGTTAGRVANHADRSVYVVREKPAPKA